MPAASSWRGTAGGGCAASAWPSATAGRMSLGACGGATCWWVWWGREVGLAWLGLAWLSCQLSEYGAQQREPGPASIASYRASTATPPHTGSARGPAATQQHLLQRAGGGSRAHRARCSPAARVWPAAGVPGCGGHRWCTQRGGSSSGAPATQLLWPERYSGHSTLPWGPAAGAPGAVYPAGVGPRRTSRHLCDLRCVRYGAVDQDLQG